MQSVKTQMTKSPTTILDTIGNTSAHGVNRHARATPTFN